MARKSIKKAAKKTAGKPQRQSKKAAVLALLRRKAGATIDGLVVATGWQAHSVRGFLSGTVKKKLALKLTSDKPGNADRCYYLRGRS